MKNILIVGVGGFMGSVARYGLSNWLQPFTAQGRFPYGTFVVNVAGCWVAGVLAGMAEKNGWFGPQTRLLFFTGLLGGFTTFSAFGLETMFLLRRGEVSVALAYTLGSLLLGVGAVWLGMRSASFLSA